MHKYFSWKQTRAYTDDEWRTLVIAWCKLHSKLEDLIRVSTKVKIEDKKTPTPHDFLCDSLRHFLIVINSVPRNIACSKWLRIYIRLFFLVFLALLIHPLDAS